MNNNISILGCGWLGKALAESLISGNYNVKGSTTQTEKLSNLTGREDDKINSNADVVFKYTTASIKTFLANNPEKEQSIKIFTDDVALIKENISKYIGSKKVMIIENGSIEHCHIFT